MAGGGVDLCVNVSVFILFVLCALPSVAHDQDVGQMQRS